MNGTKPYSGIPEGSIWKAIISRYNRPNRRMSILTIVDSFLPFVILWYVTYRFLSVSWLISLVLAIPTALFLVRCFIIFHDCGHGSFFKSRSWCNIVGSVFGVFLMTPYWKWTREHAIHHATVGNLDRRGVGDVETMTVSEYARAPRWKRFTYRLIRHPLFLFTIGSFFDFIILQRYQAQYKDKVHITGDAFSVYGTNLAIVLVFGTLAFFIGLPAVLFVQLTIMFFAASMGVWLFFIQHQWYGAYWVRHDQWDYATVALRAASHYKLPGILNWFTGNIGFHNVHHLSPRIPSYKLSRCYRENALFKMSHTLTIHQSFKTRHLKLWDEKNHMIVGFDAVKELAPL
jgi:acyl-lipid omega-6 desaturase (Delta-12 desaturase)